MGYGSEKFMADSDDTNPESVSLTSILTHVSPHAKL